ncbi:hypothetical protein GGR50DRAFT_644497 [Xylaria sp. CBS 124048]|nr:hypothetical protein GGR50DRAFT_644497 [Xylaria sp. CBS 124048]
MHLSVKANISTVRKPCKAHGSNINGSLDAETYTDLHFSHLQQSRCKSSFTSLVTSLQRVLRGMPVELPVLTVPDAAAWANWLVRSAATAKGVWLTLAKKGNTTPTTLTYAQALDEALCQGWIDGQARRGDERTYSQRFTPRTAKSLWSRRNVAHIARLEQEGRITALGRAAIEAAKADGRWDSAYAGQASAELPPEFLAAVAAAGPKAQSTWDSMSRSDRFMVYFRLNSLKTKAGREKRIAAFVEMLSRGETLSSRSGTPATTSSGKVTGKTVSKKAVLRKKLESEQSAAITPVQPVAVPPGEVEGVRRSARLLGLGQHGNPGR